MFPFLYILSRRSRSETLSVSEGSSVRLLTEHSLRPGTRPQKSTIQHQVEERHYLQFYTHIGSKINFLYIKYVVLNSLSLLQVC